MPHRVRNMQMRHHDVHKSPYIRHDTILVSVVLLLAIMNLISHYDNRSYLYPQFCFDALEPKSALLWSGVVSRPSVRPSVVVNFLHNRLLRWTR